MTETDYDWTTGGDPDLVHCKVISRAGATSVVHQVQYLHVIRTVADIENRYKIKESNRFSSSHLDRKLV